MKKPAKAAAKKAVKNNKKPVTVQKKAAKPAPKKVIAKATAKNKIKPKNKVMAKIKSKAPLKVNNKKVLEKKKPLKKVIPIKKIDNKKEIAMKKAQGKIQDKIQEKQKAKDLKLELLKKNKQKELDKKSKEQAKKSKEAEKLALKAKKENEKKLKLLEKENAKLEAKRQKEAAKIAAKKAKMKGKGGMSPEEDEEGAESKPRFEEDEDLLEDDFTGSKPTKMIFDDEFEEEIPIKKKKASVDDNIKDSLAEEILSLTEEYTLNDVFSSIRSMELFKVDNDECVVRGCDNPSTTNGYCRYHYLKLWKEVKKKEQILQEGRLAKIIEDLVRKYPMKYIEAMVQDLADDKSFNHVLKDLDIETEEADLENFDDEDLLDDDQDIAFETKVVKPSFDD